MRREKPKYTLDDFFRVQTEVTVAGKTIMVRTLSDAELQMASTAGRLASMERRAELSSDGNPERAAWLFALQNAPVESILDTIRAFKREEVEHLLRQQRRPPVVVMPDNPSAEEEEEVIKERIRQSAEYEEEIKRQADSATDEYIDTIANKPKSALIDIADEYFIGERCLSAFNTAYNYTLLLHACSYKSGTRVFKCVEDVEKTNPQVLSMLLQTYIQVQGVDVNTLEDFFETTC